MIVAEALQQATIALRSSSDSARLDAEVLLSHLLKTDRGGLLVRSNQQLKQHQQRQFLRMIEQRRDHVPVAYLTNTAPFMHLTLRITQHVLVPRPCTEILVEHIYKQLGRSYTGTILDIGTGSGAIALALASLLPQATVLGTDIDRQALRVARSNARRLHIHSANFRQSDLMNNISAHLKPNVVVANLPYLTHAQLREPSIRHEPRHALVAAQHGMALITKLIRQISDIPSIEMLALEFDPSQRTSVIRQVRRWSPKSTILPVTDGRHTRGLIAWKN